MWLFFTFLAAILWGVGPVLTKKGLFHTTPLFNNLLAALITLTVTIPYAIFSGAKFSDIPAILPLSLFIAALLLSYYYVIAKADISLVGTVLGIYPLFTVILSLLFLHENPSFFQKTSVFFVMLGTVLLAVGEDLGASKKLRFGSWFFWGIGGAAAAGSSDFFAKIAMKMVEERTYSYILTYGIAFVIVALLSAVFDKKGRKIPKLNKNFLPTLIGVFIVEVGLVAFYIALSLGYASVTAPVVSVHVAITAVLAWVFLKEKSNKLQVLGVLCSTVGIVLLGF